MSPVPGAVAWLEARDLPPPAPLRHALEQLLDARDSGGSVAETMAATALDALGDVAVGAVHRDGARGLLAVDALVTYAFEAAAEEGPESLHRVLSLLSLERFAAALDSLEGP